MAHCGEGKVGQPGGTESSPSPPSPAPWATPSPPFRPTPLVAQSLALRCAGFEVCTTRCCMSRQVRFLLQRREGGRGGLSLWAQALETQGCPAGGAVRTFPFGARHLLGLQGERDDASGQGGRGRGARVRLGALLPQISGHLQGQRRWWARGEWRPEWPPARPPSPTGPEPTGGVVSQG